MILVHFYCWWMCHNGANTIYQELKSYSRLIMSTLLRKQKKLRQNFPLPPMLLRYESFKPLTGLFVLKTPLINILLFFQVNEPNENTTVDHSNDVSSSSPAVETTNLGSRMEVAPLHDEEGTLEVLVSEALPLASLSPANVTKPSSSTKHSVVSNLRAMLSPPSPSAEEVPC